MLLTWQAEKNKSVEACRQPWSQADGREESWNQGDQKIRKKMRQIYQIIAQKVAKSKKGQNIYNKAQFESPKHLHQTIFKTLKYQQTNHVLKLLI